jgi:hypothetical protein
MSRSWLFVDQPHREVNARAFSWIALLLAFLAVTVSSFVAGVAMLRSRLGPAWLGAALTLLLPATVIAGAVGIAFAPMPFGVSAILIGLGTVPTVDPTPR